MALLTLFSCQLNYLITSYAAAEQCWCVREAGRKNKAFKGQEGLDLFLWDNEEKFVKSIEGLKVWGVFFFK